MPDLPDVAPAAGRLRRWIVALVWSIALGLLVRAEAFSSTQLRCRHHEASTRCTIDERLLGFERATSVMADVQGAHLDEQTHAVMLRSTGGELALPTAFGRQVVTVERVNAFVSDPLSRELTFASRDAWGATGLAIVSLLALGLSFWPRRRVPVAPTPDTPEAATPEVTSPVALPVASEEAAWADRLLGAALFRARAYRELASDPRASWPAAIVVIFVGMVVGYAEGLSGDSLYLNGQRFEPGLMHANVRALATGAAALVSWLVASVITSWLSAGRGGVRTLQLARALGFANLLHLLGLLQHGGLLAWPLYFLAAYVVTRSVGSAGRLRSLFATWMGQGVALMLSVPMWLAVLGFALDR